MKEKVSIAQGLNVSQAIFVCHRQVGDGSEETVCTGFSKCNDPTTIGGPLTNG